jgi:hypothetical protein
MRALRLLFSKGMVGPREKRLELARCWGRVHLLIEIYH